MTNVSACGDGYVTAYNHFVSKRWEQRTSVSNDRIIVRVTILFIVAPISSHALPSYIISLNGLYFHSYYYKKYSLLFLG
ncbi:MAG TPA: hypothetical protein VE971_02820 [Candidatus Eisenbacteria bacterium]|nr:hypothetical protein [Candidatus Eisenbacteria bacterium]